NVGRGPALNIRYLERWRKDDATSTWQMTKRFSLSGGDGVADHSWVETDPTSRVPRMAEPADQVWGGSYPRAKEVVICQDQAGRFYRFIDPIPLPEVWREGDVPRPV